MAKDTEGGQQRAQRSSEDVEEVVETDTSDVKERHEKLTDDVDEAVRIIIESDPNVAPKRPE